MAYLVRSKEVHCHTDRWAEPLTIHRFGVRSFRFLGMGHCDESGEIVADKKYRDWEASEAQVELVFLLLSDWGVVSHGARTACWACSWVYVRYLLIEQLASKHPSDEKA